MYLHAASVAVALLCGIIAVLVLLLGLYKKGYFKGALKSTEDARTAEAAYEEVGDVFESGFTIDVNACYSLKQGPVYAEIGDTIQTQLNDAYVSTSQHANKKKTLDSSIPPRPIADMAKHLSSDNGPPQPQSLSNTSP